MHREFLGQPWRAEKVKGVRNRFRDDTEQLFNRAEKGTFYFIDMGKGIG